MTDLDRGLCLPDDLVCRIAVDDDGTPCPNPGVLPPGRETQLCRQHADAVLADVSRMEKRLVADIEQMLEGHRDER